MKIQNHPSSKGSTAASSIAPASPGNLEEKSSSTVERVRLEKQLSSQVEEGRLAWDGTPTGVAMSNMQDVMETSTVDPNGSNTRDVGLKIVGHPPTVLAGTRTPTSKKKVTGVMVMGSRKVKGAPVMSVRDIADHFRSLKNKTPVRGVKKTSFKTKLKIKGGTPKDKITNFNSIKRYWEKHTGSSGVLKESESRQDKD